MKNRRHGKGLLARLGNGLSFKTAMAWLDGFEDRCREHGHVEIVLRPSGTVQPADLDQWASKCGFEVHPLAGRTFPTFLVAVPQKAAA